MSKRYTLTRKVICRGNARRYGLRPSGRRNALGSALLKRRSEWFSACSPAMALIFRCNTHTAPNFRIPITSETHDPECTGDCLEKDLFFFYFLGGICRPTHMCGECLLVQSISLQTLLVLEPKYSPGQSQTVNCYRVPCAESDGRLLFWLHVQKTAGGRVRDRESCSEL